MLLTVANSRSTRRTALRAVASAAALGVATLGLAACGSSSDDSDANSAAGGDQANAEETVEPTVYNFDELITTGPTPPPTVLDGGPVVVELSEGLKEAVPADVDLAIERYLVSAKAFPGGECRVDVSIEYADGGLEALQATEREAVEANVATAAANLEQAKADAEVYGDELPTYYEQLSSYNEPTLPDFSPVRQGDPIAGTHDDDAVESIVVADALPADDELESGNWYYTEDGSAVTIVAPCSEDPEDDELVRLPFVYPGTHESGTEGWLVTGQSFATAEIVVMAGNQGGPEGQTILVTDAQVDAELSVAGEWEAAE